MRCVVLLLVSLVSAIAAWGQSGSAARTSSLPTTAARAFDGPLITQQMVEDWVLSWQKRLALSDWTVTARIVRLAELPKGTVANVHWSLSKKQATILVLDPVDSLLPRSEIRRDTELSVVHELVHLSLAKLPLNGIDTNDEEESVKKLSAALLDLYEQASDMRKLASSPDWR